MSHTAYLVQRGNRLPYTNTGSAIATKTVVVIVSGATGFIGIAETAIDATTGTGVLAIGRGDEGIWNLPKKSGDVFTLGQVVYWDPTNERLTTTNTTTNTRAGRCAKAAASAATTADVLINQS